MVDSGELMAILVVHDGVRVLCGDIFLEKNSCLHFIEYTARAPLSDSYDNMHIIVLSAVGLATY